MPKNSFRHAHLDLDLPIAKTATSALRFLRDVGATVPSSGAGTGIRYLVGPGGKIVSMTAVDSVVVGRRTVFAAFTTGETEKVATRVNLGLRVESGGLEGTLWHPRPMVNMRRSGTFESRLLELSSGSESVKAAANKQVEWLLESEHRLAGAELPPAGVSHGVVQMSVCGLTAGATASACRLAAAHAEFGRASMLLPFVLVLHVVEGLERRRSGLAFVAASMHLFPWAYEVGAVGVLGLRPALPALDDEPLFREVDLSFDSGMGRVQ